MYPQHFNDVLPELVEMARKACQVSIGQGDKAEEWFNESLWILQRLFDTSSLVIMYRHQEHVFKDSSNSFIINL